ncbi:MAG: N-6 DNA methylase, partial [Chloroflexota bacterium]
MADYFSQSQCEWPLKLELSLVHSWLQRLKKAIHPSAAFLENLAIDPLEQLSPRKQDKYHPLTLANPLTGLAQRRLLRLLAQRVLALSLTDYAPDQKYPLLVFSLPDDPELEWDEEACGTVEAEIEALTGLALNSQVLASLQLWEGEQGYRVRKRTGSFYTPSVLANRIAGQVLGRLERTDHIIDPACGGGVFLLAALDWLMAQRKSDNPGELIAGRLYGLDLNPEVVDLARLALLRRAVELKRGRVSSALLYTLATQLRSGNALIGDFPKEAADTTASLDFRGRLFEAARNGEVTITQALYTEWEASRKIGREKLVAQLTALPIFNNGSEDGRQLVALSPFDWGAEWPEVFARGGFDATLGNPPYIGFNNYSGIEKAYFAQVFAQVYNLKNDLLYYFIVRGVEVLRPEGGLGYVTSRFWKEATFAAPLRRWLVNQTRLLAVEDFGGAQLFKGALVDTCLLFAEKGTTTPDHTFEFEFEGRRERVKQAGLGEAGLPWAWLRRPALEEGLL